MLREFVKDYGTFIVALSQVAWLIVAAWFRQNIATRGDLAALEGKVTDAIGRIAQLERDRGDTPDNVDIERLRTDMAEMRGTMDRFAAEINGADRAISARIDGLDRLIKRAEHMTQTLIEHQLAKA